MKAKLGKIVKTTKLNYIQLVGDIQCVNIAKYVVQMWYNQKEKPSQKISERVSSTQSRGRTGTGVTPLVFETSASTDSAIWALAEVNFAVQRY